MADRSHTTAPVTVHQSTGVHKYSQKVRTNTTAVVQGPDQLSGHWTVQDLNERYQLDVHAIGGTFTVTFLGQTTAGLAYNINGTGLQTALAGLSTIGAGNVSVTGPAGGPYHIELIGTLANSAFGATDMTVSGASLTKTNEVQTITLVGATGGTFTLTFGANTTAALPYNDSAANVQTALTGLASIGAGNATVTGNAGGPYTVTFVSALAGAAQNMIAINGASLTPSGSGGYVTETTVGGVSSATLTVLQTGSSNGSASKPLVGGHDDPAITSSTLPEVPTAAKWDGAYQQPRTGTVTIPTPALSGEEQTRKYASETGRFGTVRKVPSTSWSTQQSSGFRP